MWLWLIPLSLIVLAAGCDGFGKMIPGDGTLVIVDYDDDFDTNYVPFGTNFRKESDSVRDGIHMWNQLGANLRTMDEIGPEQWDAAQKAPKYRIKRDTFSWPGVSDKPTGCEWGAGLDYATIYVKALDPFTYYTLRAVVAHELGHAIGLNHIDTWGIMHAHINDNNETPSPEDVAEYHKQYPPKAGVA